MRAPGGGTWSPWATALGRGLMAYEIYPMMAEDGRLIATREGRTVLATFLLATLAGAVALYAWFTRRAARRDAGDAASAPR